MKRHILLLFFCINLLFVTIFFSPAFGAFRMNAYSFGMFCSNASLEDVKNALKAGSDMDLMAISNAAGHNPDPEVTMFLLSEAKKAGVDAINMPYGIITPLQRAIENPNPIPIVRALLNAGAKPTDLIISMAERHCKPSAKSEVLRMLRQAMGITTSQESSNSHEKQSYNNETNMTPEQLYGLAFQSYIPPGDTRKGIKQDNHKAMRLFRMAAERGHMGAQFWLGWMYYAGEGDRKKLC